MKNFCVRLQERGFRIVYEPSVEITHYEFGSTGGLQKAKLLQAKHQKELERILVENDKDINADNTPFSPNIQIGRDFNYSENNGLSGIWISLIVATIFIGIITMMFLF